MSTFGHLSGVSVSIHLRGHDRIAADQVLPFNILVSRPQTNVAHSVPFQCVATSGRRQLSHCLLQWCSLVQDSSPGSATAAGMADPNDLFNDSPPPWWLTDDDDNDGEIADGSCNSSIFTIGHGLHVKYYAAGSRKRINQIKASVGLP